MCRGLKMPKNELEKSEERMSAFWGWLAESWVTMKDMGQILKKMSAAEKKRFAMMVSVMIVAVVLLGGCNDIEAFPGTPTGDPGYRETPTWVAPLTEVYVSRTPTPEATRTLTQTPTVATDTATTTVTATPTRTERPEVIVWGSVDLAPMSSLSSERMEELATLLGRGNNFVEEGYDFTFPERDREIRGISSGNVISIIVNEPSTGMNLGVVDAAEFVSWGQNGQAFSYWAVLQTRPAGSLTTDLRRDLTLFLFQDWSRASEAAYTLEELRRFLDRNLILEFSYYSGGCASRMLDQEEAICRSLYSSVKPSYLDLLAELGFWETARNGVLIFPVGGRN